MRSATFRSCRRWSSPDSRALLRTLYGRQRRLGCRRKGVKPPKSGRSRTNINGVGKDPRPPAVHHPERHFNAVDARSIDTMPQEPPLLTANRDAITQKGQRPGNRALHFQPQAVLHLEFPAKDGSLCPRRNFPGGKLKAGGVPKQAEGGEAPALPKPGDDVLFGQRGSEDMHVQRPKNQIVPVELTAQEGKVLMGVIARNAD